MPVQFHVQKWHELPRIWLQREIRELKEQLAMFRSASRLGVFVVQPPTAATSQDEPTGANARNEPTGAIARDEPTSATPQDEPTAAQRLVGVFIWVVLFSSPSLSQPVGRRITFSVHRWMQECPPLSHSHSSGVVSSVHALIYACVSLTVCTRMLRKIMVSECYVK